MRSVPAGGSPVGQNTGTQAEHSDVCTDSTISESLSANPLAHRLPPGGTDLTGSVTSVTPIGNDFGACGRTRTYEVTVDA
jgi:hypothetical protein